MPNVFKAHAGALLLCFAACVQAAQPAPPADPSQAEIAALKRGFAALEAKKPDTAVDTFRALSSSANPDMAALALEGMGHAYRQKLDFTKTVSSFEQSLALPTTMPRDLPALHQHIGMAAVLAGQYGTAVKHLSSWKAAWEAHEPSGAYEYANSVLVYLAVALAEQRQYPQALKAIEQSQALKPTAGANTIQNAIEAAAKSGKAKPGAIAGLLKPGP
ncbi:Tetratricopeptide repeat [Bordetella ansorpii]|uniref:Tetratricopeptide repeat n=1 Tax=Bordetella ansorpii TaxID=288768 RepID=A0A157LRQ2_9BORD|nr:hypothetical protein [Bordetella ansorpii]SAH99462.1 Tetratricopeptide repeat [Bordetella ansorpii]